MIRRRWWGAVLTMVCWPAQAQPVVGEALFAQQCAVCHQADASGVVGSFPPLRSAHVQRLLSDDGTYPARVLLQGLSGRIEVGNEAYNGVMPAFPSLTDAQIASLVRHLGELNEVTVAMTPQAVAALRTQPNKQKLRDLRSTLLGH